MNGPQCPKCNVVLNRASHVGLKAVAPRPGDLSICLECGQLLRFTTTGLEKLPDESLQKLSEDTRFQLLEMQRMIREDIN